MVSPLALSQLYKTCDSSVFKFKSTKELQELAQPLGQERALQAVDFSANIEQDGYNLYAMGTSGSGKFTTIKDLLDAKSKEIAAPSDWCYVNNFKDSRKPIAIEFPPGNAMPFKDDIYELIELLKSILPTVFESDAYLGDIEALTTKYMNKESQLFDKLKEQATLHDVAVNISSKNRISFAPVRDGKVISTEEFNAIDGEEKQKIEEKINDFEAIVKDYLRAGNELSKAQHKEFKELERRITQESVESLIEEVRAKYTDNEKITDYLNALQDDVIRHVKDFLAKPEESNAPSFLQEFYTPSFDRYEVNVFISHEDSVNAPVVYEDNPIYQNLIGRIEHLSHMGSLVTDFNMIKPGSLHKANGGYLIIDARKLLMQPFSYEELKRVLRSKEARIESLAQQYSLISTTTLEPEPIPIDLKVVLIGERILYYMLHHYDPEFQELFKVVADFEDEIELTDDNIQLYAQMIGTIAKRETLRPLSPQAVARVIEQSSREVSHAAKFSAHLRTISDLLKEADYWSKKNSHKIIDRADINKVLQTRKERLNRVQLKLYEQIDEGTIMINLDGAVVGQINALSYIAMGEYNFGLPARITARTRVGKGEVIDIERQVELGGPIHSKGVMILSAYLGSTYAADQPLSLSASLVFEQSYGKIEGDSASSTELYAILSSLADLPIKQNIAVTGSVNQFGEIQAIGGVNEKIEGFFDICMRKDPDAEYAVMIPHSNIKHLMLKTEVREAVEQGKFAIYAVKTINEGIEILTGVEAGIADKRGKYPTSSVNGKVVARLKKFFKKAIDVNQSKKPKSLDK